MPTHWEGSTEERIALDAYIKLWRASQSVESRANRHLGDHDLTLSQFSVLEALLFLGPMTQRKLADKILRTSGNLTMVIDNLERSGFVRRERNEKDRREVIVRLTDEGRAKVENLMDEHVKGIVEVFSALSEDEQVVLARLCKKLGVGGAT
ncbi:MarR family winged helix-turn-helix transcriptional regulator [Deinococcus yavapaiensis]|uniref:MarR family transcriptional regulator n=1 Tax=Deinococcus yavapaiensis KR-236 TaxID=694435 RepID=A0A318SPK9_9DEIO|nr:MarR family transcriptional regulator [Deinococcus yavapaiensis]PYE54763.1 MarR family transcriptional regulator [Deinococcus yavapaiensis KR-236]